MAKSDTTRRDCSAYADLPSDYIRLIKILPGDEDSDIRCHISLVSLKRQPDYIARSYAWGGKRIIYLDSHPLSPIRKNLWRVLHQARELASQIIELQSDFWIDALCIDQSHLEDRKQQVRLMAKIYERARKVPIWLGPSYNQSEISMQELTRPISCWQAKGKVFSVWKKPAGAAISGLCGRPYWRRLWIFQEIM
ncbi:HET-domain-containing protein, partial [Lepidopterella palustris CBS 459.81]